jgi:hypothetical protein
MSFSRCLLSSTLLAGVVFSASTLPLTALGSKPVAVHLEEKPVFVGEIKELAAPYLGLATVFSLGAGIVSLTLTGWRHSSRKLSKTEEQMSALKHQLQEKEALVESLRFSDSKLESSGLHFFLEEEETRVPQPVAATPQPIDRYTVVETSQPIHQSVEVEIPAAVEPLPQAAMSQKSKVQATIALAAAQAFMGYARPPLAEGGLLAIESPADHTAVDKSPQIDELLSQLKQMMVHIEKMHVVQPTTQLRSNHNAAPWQQHKVAS